MTTMQSRYAALRAADPNTAAIRLADYMRSLPEFAAADASQDGSVWSVFVDGPIYVIGDTRREGGPETTSRPPAHSESPKLETIRSADPTAALVSTRPSGKKYLILRALGDSWGRTPDRVAAKIKGAGYEEKVVDFTPAALKTPDPLKDVGFLFFQTHGATRNFSLATKSDALYSDVFFLMWTSEKVTADSNPYAEDVKAHRVVYFSANPSSGEPDEPHYAITSAFVEKYWQPEKDLFVYADACSSATDPKFVEAFIKRGAAVYVGWSNSVRSGNANFTTEKLFEILLGTAITLLPPDPPIRPFDVETAFIFLGSNVLADPTTGAALVYQPPQLPPQLDVVHAFHGLAPSISHMALNSLDPSELHIFGDFGFPDFVARDTDAGTSGFDLSTIVVIVGGTPVTVLSADPVREDTITPVCRRPDLKCHNRIAVRLPNDGGGSSGDVVVRIRGITSNSVPLTEWRHGKFTLSGPIGDGCTLTISYDLHFRADIHTYRLQLNFFQLNLSNVPAAPDSKCTYSFSGGRTDPTTGETIACSGSGEAAFQASPNIDFAVKTPTFHWSGDFSYDPTVKPPTPLFRETYFWDVAGLKGTKTSSVTGAHELTGGLLGLRGVLDQKVQLFLGDRATIKAGTVTVNDFTLSWGGIPATSPPTATTAQ